MLGHAAALPALVGAFDAPETQLHPANAAANARAQPVAHRRPAGWRGNIAKSETAGQSVLWVPSQNGLPAVALQPQNQTSSLLSAR